ncbi:hypothetical protein [uncultured Desulfobacter sp.]|uniref:DUF6848 family protein n=1 Tax=uncultured Desulfobacter sp. TaxID=240139 RepID=UPI002AAAC612|nr:hypothetical protein [uncultured Desulfobacter sp.]
MTEENTQTVEADQVQYATLEHTFHDVFSGADVTVAARFKRPSYPQADRAQKEMLKSPARAFQNLCTAVVHPDDKDRLVQNLKIYPGIGSTFGGALLKASGFADLGN